MTRKKAAPDPIPPTPVWSLYILECEDGTFYTGISVDPKKRFDAHACGKGAAYTRSHPPKAILYLEEVGTCGQALKREAEVKRLGRAGKLKLIQRGQKRAKSEKV